MITVDQARLKLSYLVKKNDIEIIKIENSAGRVLAKDIHSKVTHPPFSASAMDGYAINKSDKLSGKKLRIVGEASAGKSYPNIIQKDEAVRIFTGAPVPEGANCVVIQEDVAKQKDNIILRKKIQNEDFIRPKGHDFQIGDKISSPLLLRPVDVSLLAAMNYGKIPVYKKPHVAVISIGDELVNPGVILKKNLIIASNSFGLTSMLKSFGANATIFPIIPDNLNKTKEALAEAMSYDLIVTIGGASVGDYDFVKKASLEMGLELCFHGLAMRPGKPLMAGHFDNTPLIGLPGNPASAMVCCFVLIQPVIKQMMGLQSARKKINAILKSPLGKNGLREHYMRSILSFSDNTFFVDPLKRQDSSLLSELSLSNALLVRPISDPKLCEGSTVQVIPFFNNVI